MNKKNIIVTVSAMLVASTTLSCLAVAQESFVLDPSQHPSSPNYKPGLSTKILPLDTKLSWTKRFKGNEEFNEEERLPHQSITSNDNPMDDANSMSKDDTNLDAVGMIKQVKTDQAKIKIEHGPIERLGMPAMTMVFKVEDTSQLATLQKGQEVNFSVENSSGGFVITQIKPSSEKQINSNSLEKNVSTGTMDAHGTVTNIMNSQGKIKIKHGPIEHLGMPAMTMVFIVKDETLLKDIEKGETVNFSVDHSSGGFVITNIKSTN